MGRYSTVLGLAALLAAFGSSAADKPGFPRLAGTLLSAPQIYEDATYQSKMARLDFVTVNTWPNWKGYNTSTSSLQKVVQQVKALNPNILMFNYTILEQVGVEQGTTGAFQEAYKKVNAANWWVYQAGTSGSKTLSSWQGSGGPFYEVNLTSSSPTDSNGDRWTDWFAKWATRTYITPAPTLDGLYTDSFSWKPNQQSRGDWNRDGSGDSANDAATQRLYRLGYQHYVQAYRSAAPGKLIIGNLSNWGAPESTLTEYNGVLNGGIIEGLVGLSWSPETFSGWKGALNWYRKTMAAIAEPKLVIFHQIGAPTDYRGMRYGLATALMDDGYYEYSQTTSTKPDGDYHTMMWFDEYSANLGQAVSSPPTSAWQNGVWRRDFENGVALVNPKGNGTQTVTLESGLKRLSGSQAPSVNNGQSVQSITLSDRDGIILLRTSPASVSSAKPTPPQSVTVQ